jgi:hypothetical protein
MERRSFSQVYTRLDNKISSNVVRSVVMMNWNSGKSNHLVLCSRHPSILIASEKQQRRSVVFTVSHSRLQLLAKLSILDGVES